MRKTYWRNSNNDCVLLFIPKYNTHEKGSIAI